MIISASRRTDIPAYYMDWLCNRLTDGYAEARNPYRPTQLQRIDLRPEAVDGLVFWSKNPAPMLSRLEPLKPYAYYIQFTLTPYDTDIEPALPDKWKTLIPCFQRLSDALGAKRVLWRYDPILINARYCAAFHEDAFARMAGALAGYTRQCTISFLDSYRHIARQMAQHGVQAPDEALQRQLAGTLAQIAAAHGIALTACAEALDLRPQGVMPGCCIDSALLSRIAGRDISAPRDSAQRPGCGCAKSVDIGAYHCCPNGCLYCYANHGQEAVKKRLACYDAQAPVLCDTMQA